MNQDFFKQLQNHVPLKAKFPLPYLVPVYHAVSDEHLPHLKHIINYKNSKEFEADLDEMAKNFNFVDWETFKQKQTEKTNHGKKQALLTFDDGLLEFKEVVAPILLKKGIYAINFINPAFVGTADMMFRVKASLLIDHLHQQPKSFKLLQENYGFNDPKQAIAHLQSIKYQQKDQLLDFSHQLEFDLEAYQHKIYLDLEDLQQLKNQGFGLAAHSWDHPFFAQLDLAAQLKSAQSSLNYMAKHGFLDDAFAFPFSDFGLKKEFFEQLFKQEKQLNFSFGTAGLKTDDFAQNLQRLPMENGFSAKTELAFAQNYFQIKRCFNKNNLPR